MKTLLLIGLTIAACATPPDADHASAEVNSGLPEDGAAPSNAEIWLEAIEQRAREIKTLTAEVAYDRYQQLKGDEQHRFGTLAYQAGQPARFMIHFDRMIDNGRKRRQDERWIFDGFWLAQRNDKDKILIRYQLVRHGRPPKDALELGTGPLLLPLNMKKEVVLSRYDVTVQVEEQLHLHLVPRDSAQMKLTEIDLWYDLDTLLPQRFRSLEGGSGYESIAHLKEVVLNEELNDVSFDTTKPPRGQWTIEERLLPEQPPPHQ